MKSRLISELNNDELNDYYSSKLYLQVVLNDYLFTKTSINFYQEINDNSHRNYSIIIFDNNLPIMVTYAFCKNETFSFFNMPIKVHSIDDNILAYRCLFEKLKLIFKQNKFAELIFESNIFINSKFHSFSGSKIKKEIKINLSLDEVSLKQNLRKSYKSLVNWGKKNLELIFIDYNNSDRSLFNEFKKLHFDASGRKTRSDKSWEIQFQAIECNEAFLVLSKYENKLVGGTYVLLGLKNAYYGVGAYDRDLMKQNIPIGHFPLFSSIIYAKKLKKTSFDLGYIYSDSIDEKEKNIFNFKNGFSNLLHSSVINNFKIK